MTTSCTIDPLIESMPILSMILLVFVTAELKLTSRQSKDDIDLIHCYVVN